MSKNNQQDKQQAKPAEFDDDAGIDFEFDDTGADDFVVDGGDPRFHYFLAAKDHSDNRPDSVKAVERLGYEKCTMESTVGGGDCVLMRIPRKVFEARRARKRNARRAAKEALAQPKGVPANALVHLDERGDRPGSSDEDG